MTVRANVSDLHGLERLLQVEPVRKRLLQAAAAEAKALVQQGFRTETDPSGNKWQPLKRRKGKILRKTARMANSFTSRPTDRGFVVGSNVAYVTYHQDGTRGHAKDFSRSQAMHIGETYMGFVRNAGRGIGKARVRAEDGKRKLTYFGVSRTVMLNFKAGGGAIPIRRMVPENGKLTERWQQAIDKSVRSTLANMIREAGGR